MEKSAVMAAVLACSLICPASAHAEQDFQIWGAATATIPLGDKGVLWLEGQTRFYDDAGRLGQVLLRPGAGYRIGATETVFAGYAYVHTDLLAARDTREHRIWQQLSFRAAGDGAGLTLTGRTRFEQRFVEGSDDMGLRLRQMLRVTAPLAGKTRAIGWGEAFVALDDTAWGQRAGFDRLRTFAGGSVPLSEELAIEPGYMNEYVRRRGDDRVNHIASVTVNAMF